MDKWAKIRHKYCTYKQGLAIIDSLAQNTKRFSKGFCIPDFDPKLVKKIAEQLGYKATITGRWNVGPNYVLVIRMVVLMRAKSKS